VMCSGGDGGELVVVVISGSGCGEAVVIWDVSPSLCRSDLEFK
jgi:hypothetical protein